LVPTPLGLVSYFSGGWYGGSPTCVTYQVSSLWCSLSSLVLLSYMCVTCHLAVCSLLRVKNPHNKFSSLVQSSLVGSSKGKMLPVSNEYIDLDKSKSDPHLSRDTFQDSGNLKKEKSHKFSTTALDNMYTLLEVKDTNNGNQFHCCEKDIEKALNADTSKLTEGFINDPESQLSGENPLCPDVNLSYPKEKSILYLNLYKKSKRLKSWLRNDLYLSRRFDGPRADALCLRCPTRDYMTLTLLVLLSLTMTIALLPMLGFGPHTEQNDTTCAPWLVRKPAQTNEEIFYIAFLIFVCLCLVAGCCCGVNVCLMFSRQSKDGQRPRSMTCYYEKETTKDFWELSLLSDMQRHYRLNCVALAGQLTWIPLLLILVVQTSGVKVSDAAVMYSTVVTSLPGLLNPLLYSLVLSSYRSGYKAILRKRCCHGNRTNEVSRKCAQQSINKTMNVSSSETDCECYCDNSTILVDEHTQIVLVPDSENNEGSLADDTEDPGEDNSCSDFVMTERTPLQATFAPTASAGTFDSTSTQPWRVLTSGVMDNGFHPHIIRPGNERECNSQSYLLNIESYREETGL
ncbi:hypothetical protein BgiMline_001569, partial [Biomphalaria glabrata]